MPLDFHGLDLTHPVNRIPAGRVAMAENVRAYGQGQFELRNALSIPVPSFSILPFNRWLA